MVVVQPPSYAVLSPDGAVWRHCPVWCMARGSWRGGCLHALRLLWCRFQCCSFHHRLSPARGNFVPLRDSAGRSKALVCLVWRCGCLHVPSLVPFSLLQFCFSRIKLDEPCEREVCTSQGQSVSQQHSWWFSVIMLIAVVWRCGCLHARDWCHSEFSCSQCSGRAMQLMSVFIMRSSLLTI